MKLKIYALFSSGPDGESTNRSIKYSKGGFPWIVKVRASKIGEARSLLREQRVAVTPRDRGVVSIGHKEGPHAPWPWNIKRELVFK